MGQGRSRFVALAVLAGAAACTNFEENVVFVTATEIDIGYDAQIGNVNIGYDRNEFVVGPQYVDTGGTPPVAASITSNLSIFSPKINQIYATGNAAKIATGASADPAVGAADDLKGKRRAMFFGTSASFGLSAKLADGAPSAVNLGYKRKEISIIPLREAENRTADTVDKYGSVYAAIDIDGTVSTAAGTGVELSQFFATGSAAEALAAKGPIQVSFANMAAASAKSAEYQTGVKLAQSLTPDLELINNCVQKDGDVFTTLSTQRLGALVDSAGIVGDPATVLKAAKTKRGLSGLLRGGFAGMIGSMVAAAKQPNACDT